MLSDLEHLLSTDRYTFLRYTILPSTNSRCVRVCIVVFVMMITFEFFDELNHRCFDTQNLGPLRHFEGTKLKFDIRSYNF